MQIAFEAPGFLWFLGALPLLVVAHYLFLRYTKARALRFANFRALKRITGQRIITRNYLVLGLRIFTLAAVILAASGVYVWYEGETVNSDFVLAIDASASMLAEDVSPTRFDAAKQAAVLFVDALDPHARVGVVRFSGVSLIDLLPTSDKAKVRSAVHGMELILAGGTDIPGAIITSTNLLLDYERGRSIILITDGSSTIEVFIDDSLRRAVDYALEQRVTVHTIGVGTGIGPIGYLPVYYNVSAIYDEDSVLWISNMTGGVHANVTDMDGLIDAFQRITEDSTEQLLKRELRQELLLAALLLLFVEWILMSTRFRRIP